jgi:hypothetical protein
MAAAYHVIEYRRAAMTPRARGRLFVIFAIAFAGAAAFHAVAMVTAVEPSSARWRHALFVAIDVALAALVIRRPPWFPWVFALLLVQQAWSHGTSLVAHAQAGTVDVLSLVTLIALPVVLVLLVVDARSGPDATLRRGPASRRR